MNIADIGENLLFSTFDIRENKPETNNVEISNENIILPLLENRFFDDIRRFELRNESFLLQFAYSYNKILSLSNSRTRILAHQVESTHIIVNSLNQRFLLADEVGLGKTIEAGLVIKEMIFRYSYKKILIICPASLQVQWQNEMIEKFGEQFDIIDSATLKKKSKMLQIGENPWDSFSKIICSLDFIKSEKCYNLLKTTQWDAVIFDEAHRLRRDAQVSTLAYNLAEMLSDKTNSLLLLTATPFRGKLEELYFLIRLVDKNLLGPFKSFHSEFCCQDADLSILRKKLSQVLIRRTKKEIGGFTIRHAKTIKFEFYPEERLLYDYTTKYVAEEFNKAMQTENRAVGFVMVVFQKLLDSSSHALYSALIKRKASLTAMLNKQKEQSACHIDAMNLALDDDDDDYERNDELEEVVTLCNEKTERELMEEIATISNLIEIATNLKRNKKAEKLKEMITNLKAKGCNKFLIFTQFKTTQDFLKRFLSEFSVEVFHGSLNKDEKEIAIDNFKNNIEILICTEAGGEGRNMQFCHVLFNYDLPWSPLKIEQRIGRIHRFGQERDVNIYNFSTKDTVAEKVLEVLIKKLHLFEESIGMPDIMLGQIEEEVNLNNIFMSYAHSGKKNKTIIKEFNETVLKAKKSYEKLTDLAVVKRMDFNYDEYYRITQKERMYSNKQLENFVIKFSEIDNLSKHIIGQKNKNGLFPLKIDGQLKFGTFDSEAALSNSKYEFLAFGHPIINNAIQNCHDNNFGGLTGVKIIRFEKDTCGIIFTFVVTFRSKSEEKELIPIYVEYSKTLTSYETEKIQREFLYQHKSIEYDEAIVEKIIEKVSSASKSLYDGALNKLKQKINDKIFDMKENLDMHIDPELGKIKEAYKREIKELTELADLQEAKMKFEGKDMRSAITRTKNKIRMKSSEMDYLLSKNKRYLGITYKIDLVSAGIMIGKSL